MWVAALMFFLLTGTIGFYACCAPLPPQLRCSLVHNLPSANEELPQWEALT